MAKNLGFYQAKSYQKGRGRWTGLADIIVYHQTDGATGLDYLEKNPTFNVKLFTGTFGWYCHPTTQSTISSHFLTDRGGRFIQTVKFGDTAICNGNNASMRNLKGVRPIIKQRVDTANLYTYSIESEGYKAVGDPPGTDEGLDAIIAASYLCIDDMYKNGVKTYRPDRDHHLGHCDISPVARSGCPSANFGEKFPFDKIIAACAKYCEDKYPGWIPKETTSTVNTPNMGSTIGSTNGVGIGDTVSIITGATWYGSTSKINPVFITGKQYLVDGLSGNRAVLDKKGINSPIDVKFLKIVKKAAPTKVDTDGNPNFDVGDEVVINAGATWYGSTKKVPTWAIGPKYKIEELLNTRAVIDKKGLNSPIDTKFLTKV